MNCYDRNDFNPPKVPLCVTGGILDHVIACLKTPNYTQLQKKVYTFRFVEYSEGSRYALVPSSFGL